MTTSVFLVFALILLVFLLLPAWTSENFVAQPGLINHLKQHRLTQTAYPGFYDHSPYYNYTYLLGNPYGYFYRYPFYEQEKHCQIFPYYHSYSALDSK